MHLLIIKLNPTQGVITVLVKNGVKHCFQGYDVNNNDLENLFVINIREGLVH